MNEMDPIDNIVIAATCISASQKIHDDDGQLNSRRDNHPILEVKSRHATRKNLFLILRSDHIVYQDLNWRTHLFPENQYSRSPNYGYAFYMNYLLVNNAMHMHMGRNVT